MPEIQFKGKEFVFNHHLTVPYRPLLPNKDKSIGSGDLNENLIIQGDNLHALKALLPTYSGMVDCIFIDPPYNTGNENWAYNDNVNSPMLNEWLSSNPINKEDMLRHDKWLAMMYPRVKLLYELLSANGSIWITLDDNEIHRARMMLDEIFGETNHVATVIWHKVYSPKNTAKHFSEDHDYLIIYAKNADDWQPNLLPRTEDMEARYINPDNDTRGPWKPSDLTARNAYSRGKYTVTGPTSRTFTSGSRYWRQSYESFLDMDKDNRIWWGSDGSNMPSQKRFLSEVKSGLVPQTIWSYSEAGHTQDAKKELLNIFKHKDEDADIFVTPKPTKLLDRVLRIATGPNSVILDSFAGSGTTAHAVLALNKKDGGNRKFILVECEAYADSLTAQRVRNVIDGYEFTGLQKEELLKETITFTSLRQADRILDRVATYENLERHRFDSIRKEVREGILYVYGEKRITEKIDGLGGSFTYCTLGEPIDINKILTGENLPDYKSIGAWLFHTATGEALNQAQSDEQNWFLGESTGYYVWLIYKPELEFLKSRASALTLDLAQTISAKRDKRHLVFAPAKYVPNKALLPLGVEYAPLPFALYRVEK